jgi:hypothetical protein
MAERGRQTGGEERTASAPKPAPAGRDAKADAPAAPAPVEEIGGPKGPEPTRYGDWEKGGRCSDF